MTEENHEPFISAIKTYFEQVKRVRADSDVVADIAADKAANNDNFRAALIHIAKNDKSIYLRGRVIKSLIPLAPTHKDAREALRWVTKNDTEKWFRRQAIQGLTPLAKTHNNVYETLCWVAKNDKDPRVRVEAIKGLMPLAAEYDDVQEALDTACALLIECGKDSEESWWHRASAVEGLVLLAPTHKDAREALCWVAKNEAEKLLRRQAIKGLIPLAPTHKDAREALCWVAQNDKDPTVRATAIKGLIPLKEMPDNDRDVLDNACHALIKYITKNNYFRYDSDSNLIISCLILRAETHDDAVGALKTIAQSYEGWGGERKLAVEGLITLAAEREGARKALREIAKDKNNPVHQCAAEALESLEKQAAINQSSQQAQQLLNGLLHR